MAAINIRQPFLDPVQTLPGVEIIVQINMLVALRRAVGIHITHSNQFVGKLRQRCIAVIQAAKAEFGIHRRERQTLLHPAKGVQPRL
ncbi:hypothetical protein D3C78_1723640 [compost metagenome]